MRKRRGKPSRVMTGILLVWVFLGVAVFWKIQGAGNKSAPEWRHLAQKANMASQARRQQVSPLAPLGGNPGSWPPASGKALEMARDLTASNYLIVFDGSGSMGDRQCSGMDSKMNTAREAVKKFIRSLTPSDNVALVGFGGTRGRTNKNSNTIFEHGFIPASQPGVIETLDMVYPMGNTPLSQAMKQGYSLLEEQARRQGGYGEYHMVIITDGEATDQDPSLMARWIVHSSVVRLHVIGFCLDGRHKLDLPEYTSYSTADNPSSLDEGLRGVLSESEQFDPAEFMEQP